MPGSGVSTNSSLISHPQACCEKLGWIKE